MRVILFGATGMVGQGVLRECLLDPDVTEVLSVGRSPLGRSAPRLREIVHPDLGDLTAIAAELTGYDACFYCLGVSSIGMSEADYTRISHDLPLHAANVLLPANPGMTFVYVSGQGTDVNGRQMWARVKGRAEEALLARSEKAYMFRPGYIQPMHGVRSKTGWYQVPYTLVRPLSPLLMRLFPNAVTTTERLGRAMLNVARRGAPVRVLVPRVINAEG
ncbi:epimerase [Virgisporangium aliadipatigenens]|uniref:Epimerase n=1 Tax=Virgisporangium aliadipatigenens TaxID=741659 RepID=A0A8J3YNM4_9ACTN|nr:epimerase [Virgisporangium aliadipatigenens]GIJ48904.1 epimerase [Virgisporangium aliadipatigenens]